MYTAHSAGIKKKGQDDKMEFTKNMRNVMERAVRLVREKHHRYFMPEHLLYGITFDRDFAREYEAGGGQVEKLRQDLLDFLQEQAGTAKDKTFG